MNDLNIFEFNNNGIRFEKRDGRIWVCLTDMAKASGKLGADWKRLKSTTEFLNELESIMGIPIIESQVGGSSETTGTWAVEEVAIEFASWCSVSFKIWMLQQIKTLLKEGTVSIRPKSALELAREQVVLLEQLEEKERLIEQQQFVIETQKNQIIEWHPLVENYRKFMDTEGLLSMGDVARMLPNTGRNRLIRVLRLLSILMPNTILPYQKYMKYFTVKVKVREHPSEDGTYKADKVTLFKPEGLNSVMRVLIKKIGSEDELLTYLTQPSLLELKLRKEKQEKDIIALAVVGECISFLDILDEQV